jgi:hypothetical protein
MDTASNYQLAHQFDVNESSEYSEYFFDADQEHKTLKKHSSTDPQSFRLPKNQFKF